MWLLLGLILLVALGCDRRPPVPREEVPGTYQVNYVGDWGTDRLDLKPDGTFEETYFMPSEDPFRTLGRWTYELRDGEPVVVLDRAVILAVVKRDLLPRGPYRLRVRRDGRDILLDKNDPDHFVIFRSVEPQ